MPTTIAVMSSRMTTWNVRKPGLGIMWNADSLPVAGFAALGLVLTFGFMLGS
jgi:hypothetical protein